MEQEDLKEWLSYPQTKWVVRKLQETRMDQLEQVVVSENKEKDVGMVLGLGLAIQIIEEVGSV